MLHLRLINPLLYEGLPSLRLTRSLRVHIAILLEKIMQTHTEETLDIILATLGTFKVHLSVCEELYSMDDLLLVQNGELASTLEVLIKRLKSACK